MKIFHTECGLQWGGQELRTLEEVRYARECGHEAWALVNEKGKMAEHAQKRGIPHYRISMKTSVDFQGFLALVKLILRHRPDIICAHNARDFYLSLPFRLLGIPVLRYRHISNPISPRWTRSFAYRYGASAVVATASFIKQQLVEQNQVAPHRIHVIGEGVDLERFHPGIDGQAIRKTWGWTQEHTVVGTVGMVRSDKGYDILIRAAAELRETFPSLRFLFIGGPTRDGTFMRQMQKLACNLGVDDRIAWTGWREDVPELMASLDIFVLASVGVEGQSRVLPEAFALKKPVIGTQIGGIPELIQHEITGLLIPHGKPTPLAEAITRYLKDPELKERCSQAGHALALNQLDFKKRMEESHALYEKILKKRKDPHKKASKI